MGSSGELIGEEGVWADAWDQMCQVKTLKSEGFLTKKRSLFTTKELLSTN